MSAALKAIAEPRRQRILQLVWDRERTAGEIAAQFDVTFGAVSQHLRVLLEAGVVEQRRDGRRRWYRSNKQALGPLAAALEVMWGDRLAKLKMLAEAEDREKTKRR
jgi:DNA-binding transcriptional ArsR family regulator